jgi:uncharacterized membrane protein HdeD (DUF308 family)
MPVLILANNWWALALRGAIAIVFGLFALLWPGMSLTALVLLFAAFAFIDGLLALIAGIRGFGRADRWGAFLLEGVLGLAIAVVTVVWPAITALVFVVLIAAWAILTGLLELIAAVRLRREVRGEWLLALGGLASLGLGLLLVLNPSAGVVVLLWLIGAYAIVFGLVLIGLGLRLRGWLKRAQPVEGIPWPA